MSDSLSWQNPITNPNRTRVAVAVGIVLAVSATLIGLSLALAGPIVTVGLLVALGGFLAMIAAFIAPQLGTRHPIFGRRRIAFGMLAVVVIGVVLTFSRGAMVTLVAAMLYISALRYGTDDGRRVEDFLLLSPIRVEAP